MAEPQDRKFRLGYEQADVLWALVDHGRWHEWCGWKWGTYNRTRRFMERLVELGLARKVTQAGREVFVPTDLGRQEAAKPRR